MNRNDLERTVKQIIEKHVDVSHASLEYQAKLARAVSAMTKQIQRILDGTLKNEYPSERRWFSVNALDYEREHVPFEEVSRDFWITRYEDSLIEQELLRFAEMVDAAAPARVNYCVDEDFLRACRFSSGVSSMCPTNTNCGVSQSVDDMLPEPPVQEPHSVFLRKPECQSSHRYTDFCFFNRGDLLSDP